MRMRVRFIFRDEERPLVRECRTTRLSTRCTQRRSFCFRCSTRHLIVVNTALNSSTLICSRSPDHLQPEIVFQRHNFPGMLALSLWYRTGTSVADCSSKSSPFKETNPQSFLTNSELQGTVEVDTANGGRSNKPWSCCCFPGVSSSQIIWGVLRPQKPRRWRRQDRNHATTGTDQEFPNKVFLQSSWASLPCSDFFMHWRV